MVVAGSAAAYGPAAITPPDVKVYGYEWYKVGCAGSNVVVLFVGCPQPQNKRGTYVAVSSNGSWRVRPVGPVPTASSRGQPSFLPKLCAEHGKAFVAYHDWIRHDTANVVEVRGNSLIPVTSVPRHELTRRAFPFPRAMAYDGRYVWVVGDGVVARIYKTQVQTFSKLRSTRVDDVVAPASKPVVLFHDLHVSRLVGQSAQWQNTAAWKDFSPPRFPKDVPRPFPTQLMQADGSRMWLANKRKTRGKYQLIVVTAPVTSNSIGRWRVLRKRLPAGVIYVDALSLARPPSGAPKLVASLRCKGSDPDELINKILVYDLNPSAIGAPRTLSEYPRSQHTFSTGLQAAIDAHGYVYAIWRDYREDRLYAVTDNPRWKAGQVAQGQQGGTGGSGAAGQQASGNQNVGAGLPDFAPSATPSLAGLRPRLTSPGGDLDVYVRIHNKGATFRRPLTVLYEFAGIKLYATATPAASSYDPKSVPAYTVLAGKYVHVYPRLRIRLRSRPSDKPLKPSFTYRDPRTGKTVTRSTPPVIVAPPRPRNRDSVVEVAAVLPLGRYTLRVVADPRHRVRELNESNNVYTRDFVVEGGSWSFYDAQHKYHRHSNDLSLYEHVMIWPKEELHMPGLVRGKAIANAWVLNLHRADWFDRVVIRATLDGNKIWQGSVGPLSRQRTVPATQFFSNASRDDKVSAALVAIPLDFSHVALGRHTLEIVVDPDDLLGDTNRSNNTWSARILIRKRGGTVIVTTKDRATQAPIAQAQVIIRRKLSGGRGKIVICSARTNSHGRAVFKDVPPGSYPAGLVRAFKRSSNVEYAYTEVPTFSVQSEKTTNVTILMERSVTLTGKVLDAATNQPVEYGAVWMDDDLHSWTRSGAYKFDLVKPGQHTFRVEAFGYRSSRHTLQVHGDAQARMTHDFRLQRLPRGTLVVKCKDDHGKPVKYAYVDLRHTPLGGTTDSNGKVTFSDVPAGRTYKVMATEENHATGIGTTPTIAAGTTTTLTLTMPAIQRKRARIKCKVTTWADLESYPGFSLGSGSSSSWKVKGEFGVFKTELVLHYHQTRGSSSGGYVHLDDLFVGFYPGDFFNATVSSTYDPGDLISGIVGKFYKPAGEALEKVGTLISVADIPNSIYDALTGEQANLKQVNDGVLYGSHTTHTGAEEESASFYSLPNTSIDLGVTVGGDWTIVLLRKVEITDGQTSISINPWWYSPGMMHWALPGKKMKWSDVVVRLNIDVLNSSLSSSVLGTRSRNDMTWRPSKQRDLRMEPTGPGG